MENVLLWIGRLGGIAGILLCAIAVALRVQGFYVVAGFEVGTLLLGGSAALVMGCFGYAAAAAERRR
jgi:hypothetical protein